MSEQAKDSAAMERIRERAYEIYQERGGGDGHELDDWLRAETQLKSLGEGSSRKKKK